MNGGGVSSVKERKVLSLHGDPKFYFSRLKLGKVFSEEYKDNINLIK